MEGGPTGRGGPPSIGGGRASHCWQLVTTCKVNTNVALLQHPPPAYGGRASPPGGPTLHGGWASMHGGQRPISLEYQIYPPSSPNIWYSSNWNACPSDGAASPFPSVQHRAHLEHDTKDVLTKSIQPVEIKHTRGSSLFSLPLKSRINQYSVGSVYCDSIGFPIQLLFATHKPCHIFLFHIFDFPQFLCHYTVIYSFCKITPCVHCTEKSAACQVRPQLFLRNYLRIFPNSRVFFESVFLRSVPGPGW